ncbi:YdcF family protein [Candidatus Gracilibacteria bacterium]|nr:YdcF family protein [Candidatus Gracilibacteria bacterium]
MGIMSIFAINSYVLSYSHEGYYQYTDNNIPSFEVGLVFGAAVWGNRGPSDILKDRLDTALQAYRDGTIEKILVSGDNGKAHYNEPVAMQKYLLEKGVSPRDIYLDYAGFDTYDTLYRAKYVFGISEVMLFTQDFHLERALYIAHRMGIHAIGVSTNRQPYINRLGNNMREILARVKAFAEVEIFKPESKYVGNPVIILSDEDIESAKQELLE